MFNILVKLLNYIYNQLDILKLKLCILIYRKRHPRQEPSPSKFNGVTEIIAAKHRKKVHMSIASIYMNEPDIIEWIEYHKLIGVERFYLYDHESTDNSKELLKPYIEDGTVVYHYAVGDGIQTAVNSDAMARYKDETEWMALIDLDEYIVPVRENDIRKIMKDYKKYPALMMSWAWFDSNGLIERPKDKLVIEAYTRTEKGYEERAFNIKSIVNPRKVTSHVNPHFCYYKNDEPAVDPDFIPQREKNRAWQQRVKFDVVQLNHYFTKSREDYIKKISRGRSDIRAGYGYTEEVLNFKDIAHDYKILKYLPELKKRMDLLKNK